MTATIKTFQSGAGDCIFLRLEKGSKRRRAQEEYERMLEEGRVK